ncbi:cilia- and flagella-associated protein 20-like [Lycodopsis pacificus]
MSVKNGHIERIVGDDVRSLVLDVRGINVSTNYNVSRRPQENIWLPFLVMTIKNLKEEFSFEVEDPSICFMPMSLDDGWNRIQLNLSDLTRGTYGTHYVMTLRVEIHASCRIRRVYFSDRLSNIR